MVRDCGHSTGDVSDYGHSIGDSQRLRTEHRRRSKTADRIQETG
ncbi:unnamed protein product [Staurois parvus]|uniref:Uncharacterized protein n=1 Tax=Staurois parvus TaxID=386267 RepID=A0ABN9BZU2_9NEOB|nr:unnamed protein product [Staurois parvus]